MIAALTGALGTGPMKGHPVFPDGSGARTGGGKLNPITGLEYPLGEGAFSVGANTASGKNSLAVGEGNTASGQNAVAIGTTSSATGANSVCSGNFHGTASGIAAHSLGAYSGSASGSSSYNIGGYVCDVSGGRAGVLGGQQNQASADDSICHGHYAASNTWGASRTIGGYGVASRGAQQGVEVVATAQTTDATPTEMRIGAGTLRLVLPNDTTVGFVIKLAARRTDADNESAFYILEGCIDRQTNAASTALVGSVTKTVVAEDTAAWDCDVTADTTNGAIAITVTGESAKTIRWAAFIHATFVTG